MKLWHKVTILSVIYVIVAVVMLINSQDEDDVKDDIIIDQDFTYSEREIKKIAENPNTPEDVKALLNDKTRPSNYTLIDTNVKVIDEGA